MHKISVTKPAIKLKLDLSTIRFNLRTKRAEVRASSE